MTRRFATRALTALTLAATAAFPLAVAAKTLVYCSEGSPENFSPSLNTTGTTFDASRPVYDGLTQFERGSTKVEPGLAESWTISPDGKTIDFHLRKGVKFHSGVNGFKPTRDFNADDVLFSFERQWKPDHPFAKVSGGKYDFFADMGMPKLLQSISKVDPYTVRFVLNAPDTTMLANLAMDFANIASAEYADFLTKSGKKEQLDQIPVGTGAFQFVMYQKDAVIRYHRNDAYWGEKAKVDDLVYAITPDATARYSKLKAGECHLSIAPRPSDLPEMQKDKTLKITSLPGLNIAYWAFNTQKPPFDKKEVRQAFSMAIDKASIIRDVYLGAGQPAKNLIPPTMWSYNDKVEGLPVRPRQGQGPAGQGRREDAAGDRPLVHAGAAPVQPERQAHRRDDAVRPGQDRRQRHARHLRVGRVPQAPAAGRAHDGRAGLDGRQRRPGQLLLPAQLRRRAPGRPEPVEVVQQGVRRQADAGQDAHRPGRSAPGCTWRCRRSSTRRRPT